MTGLIPRRVPPFREDQPPITRVWSAKKEALIYLTHLLHGLLTPEHESPSSPTHQTASKKTIHPNPRSTYIIKSLTLLEQLPKTPIFRKTSSAIILAGPCLEGQNFVTPLYELSIENSSRQFQKLKFSLSVTYTLLRTKEKEDDQNK